MFGKNSGKNVKTKRPAWLWLFVLLFVTVVSVSACALATEENAEDVASAGETLEKGPNPRPNELDTAIKGEFVIIRQERRDPFDPANIKYSWDRAVMTDEGELKALLATGMPHHTRYGSDGLVNSITFFVLGESFRYDIRFGNASGEREDIRVDFPERQISFIYPIFYSGERIKITGHIIGEHNILKGIQGFSVSTIEKID